MIATAALATPAFASHIRGGEVRWTESGANSADFTARFSAVRSFYPGTAPDGKPAVGDVIDETQGNTPFRFGDGPSSGSPADTPRLKFRVDAINVAEDYLIGTALEPGSVDDLTLSHTYAGAGPFTAGIYTGDTMGSLKNNPGGGFGIGSMVNLGSDDESPVTSVPPVISVGNDGNQSFHVPATDPGGEELRWRLATDQEGCRFRFTGCSNVNPPGFSIDADTGRVTWDTTGRPLGLYMTNIVVEATAGGEVASSSSVSFLIRVVGTTNARPIFRAPSPPDGELFDAAPGQALQIDLSADDANPGDEVEIVHNGLPANAGFTTTAGNPASGNFTMTPAADQLGQDYVVNFIAQDNGNPRASDLRSYTIRVRTATDTTPPNTTITSGPAAGSTTNDATPTFGFSSTEANSTFRCRFDAQAFAACSGPGAAHTPPNPLPAGQHTFAVRATDQAGNPDPTPASRAFTVAGGPTPPPNDPFATAELLDGANDAATGTTLGATKQASEPNHAGNGGGASVWYRWTAPATGMVKLRTCGSDFDTLLAAYSGAALDSLTPVASNDDSTGPDCAGSPQSEIEFVATAGTVYRIAVDGWDPPGTAADDPKRGAVALAIELDASDTTPPQTTITSGPGIGAATNDATPTFGFSSSESNSSFECRIDTQPFAGCSGPGATHTPPSNLSQGSHTLEVRATDQAGNTDPTPATRTFKVDTVRPQTTITSGPEADSFTNDATPSFGFSSNEPGSTFRCRYDGAAFAPCSGPGATHTPPPSLADGVHTFEVRATDTAGNTDATPAARNFTVDTIPPATTIDAGPKDGSATRDRTPTFGFSADEPVSGIECRYDENPFEPCSGPGATDTAPANLSQGSHTFEVRATDLAGNTDLTPAARTFTVDTIPPETTVTSGPVEGSTTNDATPRFDFSSNEPGSRFQCRFDGAAFTPCSGPGARHIPPSDLPDGLHALEVRARDRAGNRDLTPASRGFTVDTIAPETTVTSGPDDGSASGDLTPTFGFAASEPGSSFECRFDGSAFAPCSGPGGTHTAPANLARGPHAFEVRATDTAGNTDPTPAAREFRLDPTAPDTSITAGPATGSTTDDATPTFGFAASEPGSGFKCRFDGSAFAPCSGPGATHTPPADLAQGQHTFEVRATDPAGNTDPTPAVRTFTVSPF